LAGLFQFNLTFSMLRYDDADDEYSQVGDSQHKSPFMSGLVFSQK